MNICILHGWGQTGNDFNSLKNQLEATSTVESVLVLDLPGFGSEKLISSNWGVPEYAEWVDLKLKKWKKENIVLIGHSFGGRIAALLASCRPAYLSGLVLSGAPVLYRPTAKTVLKNNTLKRFKSFIPPHLKQAFYSQELKDAEKSGLGLIFRNVVIFDQTDTLPKINVPTLLIWGQQDSSAPLSIAKEAEKLIPHSKLIVINGAEHNSFQSHPYLFFSHLKNFIENT